MELRCLVRCFFLQLFLQVLRSAGVQARCKPDSAEITGCMELRIGFRKPII